MYLRVLFSLLKEMLVPLIYLSFLLSMFITIFFSNMAFRKPRMAELRPQMPTKMGSSF